MFVIYHNDTTITHRSATRAETWKTRSAAKAERTRAKLDTTVWLIADAQDFICTIEKTETVYSIHDTNKERPILQSVNTPRCCDPSSELYWSI